MTKKTRAIGLYLGGASMNQAGKAVGSGGQTVKRWLVAAGVPIRYSRPTYDGDTRAEALRLYTEDQLSAAKVAARLGVKRLTVKEWVEAAGVSRTMSEAASLAIASGQSRGRATSRLWRVSTKTGESWFAESSLEFLRMEQLDSDPDVATWSRCPHRIAYLGQDGKARNYVPDFAVALASGGTVIEELKPLARTVEPINVAKFGAARAFCSDRGWEFRVLTEADVGYVRRLAPSSLTREEKRERTNETRRRLWARQTPEESAARKKVRADYMRRYHRERRAKKHDLPVASFAESGTNVPTGFLIMGAEAARQVAA